MKFEHLIARRFLQRSPGSFSASLVKVAVVSIALCVLVMIMAIAILRGFQHEIEDKVIGFGSHIIVSSPFAGSAYDADPISTTRDEVNRIRQCDGVKRLQFYAHKGGMLKTDNQIHGVILKGVDTTYDTSFFSSHLTEGRWFRWGSDSVASNEVILSSTIAAKMGIQVGDKARTYFWQGNTYRARAFNVVGIYNTDLTEFDEHYMVGDLRQVQQLNQWDDTLVEGYEVLIDNFDHLDLMAQHIADCCGYDLSIHTIVDDNPAMFAWLDLLNNNIVLILIIMSLVCMAAIISAFLIMVFEKTSMVGVLKTLGATNGSIKQIFLLKSLRISLQGILIGNALAALCCFIQQHYHLVKLDSENYAMSFVPIDFNGWYFVAVSAVTLGCCLLALLLPAHYITHIDPAKTIKVES